MPSGVPNWNEFLENCWGWPDEYFGPLGSINGASNVVVGTNPPFTIQDFFAIYPKWGGTPVTDGGAVTTDGSATVTVEDASQMGVGNPVQGAGIPDGAYILSISGDTLTLSQNANATANPIILTVWNRPIVPFAVIWVYINLASASLVQARWLDAWALGICLFVAHFLTLYSQSDGKANTTASQAAAQGASTGVIVSKSVGDVSVSFQPFGALENWAAWNSSSYGQQLATLARVIGSGPMLLL